MKRSLRLCLLLPLVAMLSMGNTFPAHAAAVALPRALDTYLRGLTAKGQFSGTVLMTVRGKTVLRKGYGMADASVHALNTPTTEFSIASISKQFTATAILELQDAGKLDVHDDICAYLATCPALWSGITIEQLLNHTSGIPDFFGRSLDMTQSMSMDELVAYIAAKPLEFPPGTRWSYSNSGYVLLAEIIQRITGASYTTYLQQHVLAPLGLTHTGIELNNGTDLHHAAGYRTILDTTPLPSILIDPTLLVGCGELYSTVDDLAKWDRALWAHTLISTRSFNEMIAPNASVVPGSGLSYGYGVFLDSYAAHRVLWHDGSLPGFVSMNITLPDDNITVVVLSNDGTADVDDIGTALVGQALQGH